MARMAAFAPLAFNVSRILSELQQGDPQAAGRTESEEAPGPGGEDAENTDSTEEA